MVDVVADDDVSPVGLAVPSCTCVVGSSDCCLFFVMAIAKQVSVTKAPRINTPHRISNDDTFQNSLLAAGKKWRQHPQSDNGSKKESSQKQLQRRLWMLTNHKHVLHDIHQEAHTKRHTRRRISRTLGLQLKVNYDENKNRTEEKRRLPTKCGTNNSYNEFCCIDSKTNFFFSSFFQCLTFKSFVNFKCHMAVDKTPKLWLRFVEGFPKNLSTQEKTKRK